MPPMRDAQGRFISSGAARGGGRDIKAEVRGLAQAQAKIDQMIVDLHGREMLDGMRAATLIVSRDAKMNAPVDEGTLRTSITPDVRLEGRDVVGVVGSKVVYAPYMEFGTGVYAGRSPHYPPAGALETWARRRGTTGYLVARAIGMAGGLKPRKYLQRAFDKNLERIKELIGETVSKIVRK